MSIRNAARAILVDRGKILLNKNQNSTGDSLYGLPNGAIYYDLPGGGQNQYETLEEAVRRECLEETGYAVAVQRLAAICEEISAHEGFRRDCPQYAHKVHFLFVCRLADEPQKPLGEKDMDYLESVWVDLEEMKNILLYPKIIHENLPRMLASDDILYLGSERV